MPIGRRKPGPMFPKEEKEAFPERRMRKCSTNRSSSTLNMLWTSARSHLRRGCRTKEVGVPERHIHGPWMGRVTPHHPTPCDSWRVLLTELVFQTPGHVVWKPRCPTAVQGYSTVEVPYSGYVRNAMMLLLWEHLSSSAEFEDLSEISRCAAIISGHESCTKRL